ncbi:unnamed protein product [Caenorhabditis auriculariae]|uniref:Protein kinase domain-containing protein n=1 Tax=Caenorhabditis auriculariae TaxID=2777116 RepID=A0A8S1HQ04_9PELO|nr:unnamed protein product [Caenorhabditis auriculariae]
MSAKNLKKLEKPMIDAKTELVDVKNQKFLVGTQFVKRSSGTINYCTQVDSGKEFVVKFESSENGPLFSEVNVYQRILRPEHLDKYKADKDLTWLALPQVITNGVFQYKKETERKRFLIIPKYLISLDKIVEAGRIASKDVLDATKSIINALEYLHGQGYTHSNIKPSNIMLTVFKDYSTIVLIDYSLSRKTKPNEDKPSPSRVLSGVFDSTDCHNGYFPSFRGDLEMPIKKSRKKIREAKEKLLQSPDSIDEVLDDPQCAHLVKTLLEASTQISYKVRPNYPELKEALFGEDPVNFDLDGLEKKEGTKKGARQPKIAVSDAEDDGHPALKVRGAKKAAENFTDQFDDDEPSSKKKAAPKRAARKIAVEAQEDSEGSDGTPAKKAKGTKKVEKEPKKKAPAKGSKKIGADPNLEAEDVAKVATPARDEDEPKKKGRAAKKAAPESSAQTDEPMETEPPAKKKAAAKGPKKAISEPSEIASVVTPSKDEEAAGEPKKGRKAKKDDSEPPKKKAPVRGTKKIIADQGSGDEAEEEPKPKKAAAKGPRKPAPAPEPEEAPEDIAPEEQSKKKPAARGAKKATPPALEPEEAPEDVAPEEEPKKKPAAKGAKKAAAPAPEPEEAPEDVAPEEAPEDVAPEEEPKKKPAARGVKKAAAPALEPEVDAPLAGEDPKPRKTAPKGPKKAAPEPEPEEEPRQKKTGARNAKKTSPESDYASENGDSEAEEVPIKKTTTARIARKTPPESDDASQDDSEVEEEQKPKKPAVRGAKKQVEAANLVEEPPKNKKGTKKNEAQQEEPEAAKPAKKPRGVKKEAPEVEETAPKRKNAKASEEVAEAPKTVRGRKVPVKSDKEKENEPVEERQEAPKKTRAPKKKGQPMVEEADEQMLEAPRRAASETTTNRTFTIGPASDDFPDFAGSPATFLFTSTSKRATPSTNPENSTFIISQADATFTVSSNRNSPFEDQENEPIGGNVKNSGRVRAGKKDAPENPIKKPAVRAGAVRKRVLGADPVETGPENAVFQPKTMNGAVQRTVAAAKKIGNKYRRLSQGRTTADGLAEAVPGLKLKKGRRSAILRVVPRRANSRLDHEDEDSQGNPPSPPNQPFFSH